MKYLLTLFVVAVISTFSAQSLSFAEKHKVQEKEIHIVDPMFISAEMTESTIKAVFTVDRIKSEFVARLAEDYKTFSNEGRVGILDIIAKMGEQERFNEILNRQ